MVPTASTKIDSGSGIVNLLVGLREFLKHCVQS